MHTGTDDGSVETHTAGRAEIEDMLCYCRCAMTYSPMPLAAVEGRDHTVLYVNPTFCHLVGKAAAELIGQPFVLAVPEGKVNGCSAMLDRVYQTGVTETLADQEHAPAQADSSPKSFNTAFDSSPPAVYWSYVAWPVLAAGGRRVAVMIQVTDTTDSVLFHHEVTTVNQELLISNVRQHELREAAETLNASLQALAATDGLTGLSNHRAFQEMLQEEVSRSQRYNTPLSLLFIDVDKFKLYNDAFGHPAGDCVLRKVGQVLQAAARASDLVARYGGEEFAVILIETDADNARTAAERFRAAIEGTGWQERQITISVGATTLSQTAGSPASLIAEADKSLYYSKARGRNCVTHIDDVLEREENIDETALAVIKHK